MAETLLTPSRVLLYGREILDLKITRTGNPDNPEERLEPPDNPAPAVSGLEQTPDPDQPTSYPGELPRKGRNSFLEKQLGAPEARFARIYAFTYEGHYYELSRPALFLVHGPGSDPEALRPGPGRPEGRYDRAPADADRIGVARTSASYAEDMRVWSYDKGDFSIRFDIETGPFQEILLEAEVKSERLQMHYSGDRLRLRMGRGGPTD